MSTGWMLRHSGQAAAGPFSLQQLVDAARQGHILAATEVQHPEHTQGKWVLASRIKSIRDAMAQAGPEPPPVVNPASPAPFPGTPIEPSPAYIRPPNDWSRPVDRKAVSKVWAFRITEETARRVQAGVYALAGLMILLFLMMLTVEFQSAGGALQQAAVAACMTGWIIAVYCLASCLEKVVQSLIARPPDQAKD